MDFENKQITDWLDKYGSAKIIWNTHLFGLAGNQGCHEWLSGLAGYAGNG